MTTEFGWMINDCKQYDQEQCGDCQEFGGSVKVGCYWPQPRDEVTKSKMKVRIKEGAQIYQDHRFTCWPGCVPPNSEYAGEEYRYCAKNPTMEFDGTWNGRYWVCKADGYGHLKHNGDPGEYGNGSIIVEGEGGVEILPEG